MAAAYARSCAFHGCHNAVATRCECCADETPFCVEHGSRARDRLRGDVEVSFPAACWKCGGYNADA
jgi:hypothetical protein